MEEPRVQGFHQETILVHKGRKEFLRKNPDWLKKHRDRDNLLGQGLSEGKTLFYKEDCLNSLAISDTLQAFKHNPLGEIRKLAPYKIFGESYRQTLWKYREPLSEEIFCKSRGVCRIGGHKD